MAPGAPGRNSYSIFPPQPGWLQVHSTSGVFSIASHCALQYLSSDWQAQGG